MILKIVVGMGEMGPKWYQCDRVLVGGFNGASGGPGQVSYSSRTLHLECNDERGSCTVEIFPGQKAYLLNDAGKTIDSFFYND